MVIFRYEFPTWRRANSKIIIPAAAWLLITFTLNISHRISLHVILWNSRTIVTALREYCFKCWLILRAHRCEYLIVNNKVELTYEMYVLICEPDTRRYRNHYELYETIHWVTKHFASLTWSIKLTYVRTWKYLYALSAKELYSNENEKNIKVNVFFK